MNIEVYVVIIKYDACVVWYLVSEKTYFYSIGDYILDEYDREFGVTEVFYFLSFVYVFVKLFSSTPNVWVVI